MVKCVACCITLGKHGALPCSKVAQTCSIASEPHLLCGGQACNEDKLKKHLFAFLSKYFRQGFKPPTDKHLLVHGCT